MMTHHDAWMIHALCRTDTHNDWYPERGSQCVTTAQKAKAQCDLCPVKQRCLDYALAYDEQWGIWGGINFTRTRSRDRNRMRQERGIRKLATIERTDAFIFCPGDRRRNRPKASDG